jgi:hypothetical protein
LNWLQLCTIYFRITYRPVRKIKEECFIKVCSHKFLLFFSLPSNETTIVLYLLPSMCYFLPYSNKCDRLALTNSVSGNLTTANFGFPLIHRFPPPPLPNCIALWGMFLKCPRMHACDMKGNILLEYSLRNRRSC